MRDDQILSTFQELPSGHTPPDVQKTMVFDACQMGVVLRAVLLVEAALAIVVMFSSNGAGDWVSRFALATGGGLPAAMLWLLLTCLGKRLLARLALPWQYGAAIGIGALSGAYGCMVLAFSGLLEAPPWLASACAGAALSALMVAGLVMRAKGRTPADTAARLAELQSRIHPHFLFNTLNSAIALVRAEPARAEALLEDLSDLFRHALMDTAQVTTLAEEIALGRRYLAIEEVRFGERLRVQWNLDPEADGAKLPPLLLQPLIENAVRHGVEPSAEGAQIMVSTSRRGSTVVIKVTNTVPAGQGEDGAGLALRNVRERLALMHDVQGQFRCGLKDGVFQVRVEVPV